MLSLRDLQWRRRRFAIAVLAAGLAFALTLVMSGLLNHIRLESVRMVALFDADGWVVADGASGPFTTTKLTPMTAVDAVAASPGVQEASPLLVLRSTADQVDVNVVGYELGGMTQPDQVHEGAPATQRGQAMVDASVGLDVGAEITFAGHTYPIVAVLENTSFYFGTPTVFLPIEDAQEALIAGQPLASTVLTRGTPSDLPPTLDLLTGQEVHEDLDRTLAQTAQTLDMINSLLWLVAAGIIGSIVYMSTLERVRDFAVLKATGASSRLLMGGLAIQALVLSVAAGVVAAILSLFMAPLFPFPVETPVSAYVSLLAIALVVGLLASLFGVRRVASIDPALAFGGG